MQLETFDFVVVGSGFGGSIMSMVLRRLGKSVLLIDRGAHPRFVIGESSTPFANLLLERLAKDYDLLFLRSLSEWGSWQRDFPELPCGLKRGFTFYHHNPGQPLDQEDPTTRLLVAASPNDRVADIHWYRPEFDAFMVSRAAELGVEFQDRTEIDSIENLSSGWQLLVRSLEGKRHIKANFIIDATGPNGLPHLVNEMKKCPFMPPTAGVYAHFRNVQRIAANESTASHRHVYPPDDAAVHHLFPGGWIWLLRFNNGITSAGAVLNREGPYNKRLPPRELWNSLLNTLPSVADMFHAAEPITPFYFAPHLSFRRKHAVGLNWAALPSAAGFVDPLLSTGFALNLLGILRLGQAFAKTPPDFSDYESQTACELDAAADLVSALYSKLDRFDEFAHLALLYFAAMSFTESAWRLGKPHLASGFLLANNHDFSAARMKLCARARSGSTITRGEISAAIQPFDVAGLTDWTRYPEYPVNLSDLTANAHKLHADPAALEQLVRTLSIRPIKSPLRVPSSTR